MKLITMLLPEPMLNAIEDLVRSGEYNSRSDAIRTAIRFFLKQEQPLKDMTLAIREMNETLKRRTP